MKAYGKRRDEQAPRQWHRGRRRSSGPACPCCISYKTHISGSNRIYKKRERRLAKKVCDE